MSTYIFIDGGYLRSRHAEITRKWFGFETEIDFDSVIRRLSLKRGHVPWLEVNQFNQVDESVTKCFYYDCLDEDRRQDEKDSEFRSRIEKQNAMIENIRDVEGCHIRLSALKGSRKIRRQKEVDILLAVDMMAHAAQRNMTKVVLLAGDQDFRPAVESLVQLGIFVHIFGDAKHTSRELTWAASAYTKLTFEDFYQWTPSSIQSQCRIPFSGSSPTVKDKKILKTGSMNGNKCTLYESNDGFLIYFSQLNNFQRHYTHKDLGRLELYFTFQHGSIIWDEPDGSIPQ
jgi:uncharacterized LabA/DUF88 family protein